MQSTLDSQCKHTRRSNSISISIYPDRYLFCFFQVLETILNTRTHKYKCTKRALTKSRSTTKRDERCDPNTIRRCLRCGTRLCEAWALSFFGKRTHDLLERSLKEVWTQAQPLKLTEAAQSLLLLLALLPLPLPLLVAFGSELFQRGCDCAVDSDCFGCDGCGCCCCCLFLLCACALLIPSEKAQRGVFEISLCRWD